MVLLGLILQSEVSSLWNTLLWVLFGRGEWGGTPWTRVVPLILLGLLSCYRCKSELEVILWCLTITLFHQGVPEQIAHTIYSSY